MLLCMRVKSRCRSAVTPGCLTCNHGIAECEIPYKVVLFVVLHGSDCTSECFLGLADL